MFNLGPTEIVAIVVMAILIFGPRLPQVAAEFGSWLMKFRRSVSDLRRDSGIDREIMEVRRQVENSVPREARTFDPARSLRQGVEGLKREVGAPVIEELSAARGALLEDRREPHLGPDATPVNPYPASKRASPETDGGSADLDPSPADPDPTAAQPPGTAHHP